MSLPILEPTLSPRSRSSRRAPSVEPRPKRLPGILFVEGPGDRAVIQGWARAVSPRFERTVRAATVILGGRQPARARVHLEQERKKTPELRGLCILDRDATMEDEAEPREVDGLEIRTWSRRHIESYLLDPEAIRKALRRRDHDGRLVRHLTELFPAPDDLASLRTLHAKTLLGPSGPIAAHIGRAVPLARVARAMRPEDHPAEVRQLLVRLAALLGQAPPAPVVTMRRSE